MQRKSFIRRAAKWACVGLVVLVTAVWVASGWFWTGTNWNDSGGTTWVCVSAGQVSVSRYMPQVFLAGSKWQQQWSGWRFGYESGFAGLSGFSTITSHSVPFWPLVVAGVAGVAWDWRAEARARRRTGLCAACGYDRHGLKPDAKCPECGTLRTP
jgi:hypothetical protein